MKSDFQAFVRRRKEWTKQTSIEASLCVNLVLRPLASHEKGAEASRRLATDQSSLSTRRTLPRKRGVKHRISRCSVFHVSCLFVVSHQMQETRRDDGKRKILDEQEQNEQHDELKAGRRFASMKMGEVEGVDAKKKKAV